MKEKTDLIHVDYSKKQVVVATVITDKNKETVMLLKPEVIIIVDKNDQTLCHPNCPYFDHIDKRINKNNVSCLLILGHSQNNSLEFKDDKVKYSGYFGYKRNKFCLESDGDVIGIKQD